MSLDIDLELEAEGATAWSVTEHVVVGAHRPVQPNSSEEWVDLERHYCFGVSDVCDLEVEGEGRITAGPDIIRFHSVGDHIRTRPPPDSICSSTWVLISESFIEATLQEDRCRGEFRTSPRPFARSFVQAPLPDLAILRTFFRRVEHGACGVWVEEAVASLLPRLLNGKAEYGRGVPEPTSRQRALALQADELLTHNFADAIGLSKVATTLGVSAPHLARSYRAVTGGRLHARLTSLRLAAAMERLSDGAPDITSLGLDLGFANHSHFTAAFRQAVGMPPSRFRALSTDRSNIR